MAHYGRRFRRPARSRDYPAGGGYARGFGRPRRRHGHGYAADYGPGRAYGYEYGGRGPVRSGAEWPASPRREYGYGGRRFGPERAARRGGREDVWRPGETEYGAGYIRGGARRRVRERAGRYGAAFERSGYGSQFGGPAPMTRRSGRAYGRYEEPQYGYTPSSRWPEDGHDVDHITARESAITEIGRAHV